MMETVTEAKVHILGLSCFYHDSAACLVTDGEIVAAAQEERFTRRKHDYEFPHHAVRFCLERAGIAPSELRCVIFYDKPFVKFERILESYLAYAPLSIRSFLTAMPVWIKKKLFMRETIANAVGFGGKVLFAEHHESHAASAFFPSPFREAAILTVDGVGEWATASYGIGRDNDLSILAELHFPHSLGMLYTAFTYYTGFKVNSGEYKVMGLAPYGNPVYRDLILDNLLDLKEDGSFRLNMRYFDYAAGLTMTNDAFHRLFGGAPRKPETRIEQRHMDLARSVQDVTEEIMFRIARHVRRETGLPNLCLAGGVALNCVANGKILRDGIFDEIWIQPAAGDAGGALGAALAAWHRYLGKPRLAGSRDSQKASYLGPSYDDDQIEAFLRSRQVTYRRVSPERLPEEVAALIEGEKVIGWFQGRMEFGPRALGGRSIIGDPRSREMQSVMNLKIKYRESFRPFAPTVLAERVGEFFDLEKESPYMLLVAPVRDDKRLPEAEVEAAEGFAKLKVAKSQVPAITHVDYSARIQTIHRDDNPVYYDTIEAFRRRTGVPLVINTSFNVRGEPIVCSPEEAFTCFMRTEMDYLVLGNIILDKREMPPWQEERDWRTEYELD
jgi:carbamoyltransferase